MNLWQAIVLGVIQGLTEFLPVSSSGHLVILPWLFGWQQPDVLFDTILHLGTAVAVIIVFWHDIIALIVAWFGSIFAHKATPTSRRAWLLVLAVIPGALLGFFLNDFFESLFGTPRLVAALLLVTAVILWLSERFARQARTLANLNWKDALIIGVAQGIAIAPGISRSGATLSAGILRGLKREDAARFSFLMAIPIIIGAAGYNLLKTPVATAQPGLLAAGFMAALVSGIAVIRAFLQFVRNHSLNPFACYCALLGLTTLVVSLVR